MALLLALSCQLSPATITPLRKHPAFGGLKQRGQVRREAVVLKASLGDLLLGFDWQFGVPNKGRSLMHQLTAYSAGYQRLALAVCAFAARLNGDLSTRVTRAGNGAKAVITYEQKRSGGKDIQSVMREVKARAEKALQ